MIVEDEKCLLKLATIILTARGYEVVGAADGLQALKIMERGDIDLILLDVMLPGIDGFEVCRRIKQNDAYSDIPVVMLTAKKNQTDLDRGNEVGAAWYITKPFKSSNVIETVERLL
ncbi:MAG: two-component system response regulator [Desulfobacteraceae bacterium 4572_35.1]|nr:MAG: two-component system response regulator [Desulfobacteraceae bacterium 4572_35.1]